MTRRMLWLALLAAAAAPHATLADEVVARSLAATCTGCHGSNGVSAGGIPSIAGLEQSRIVTLMKEFREGKREATLMHQHAKGYTDEQIDAIAGWFATQK